MIRTVTMLFVHDVEATSAWYQGFLGMRSGHGGSEFEMLFSGDSLLLQLHRIDPDDHDHGVGLSGDLGNGVVVVLNVEDVKAAFAKAGELGLELVSELHFNELAGHDEFTVRDPNGYSLMVCQRR